MIPIEQIRRMIEGESDDARYTAWLELYSSTGEEAKKEIERIITASDPILKILLIRFLGHISEKRAIFILRDLLSDPNSVVVEAAEKAYERNKYQRKVYALVPLLHSSNAQTRDYAIEQLSLGGIVEIIDPMLKMMEKATLELLLKILDALRHLAEKRLIPLLAPYLKDSRAEVRYKTVLIFGALYEGGHYSARSFLIKLLKDGDRTIRQAVLWCLRKQPNVRDLPLLFDISVHDPEPLVRQEALMALPAFPTPRVIHHLLEILAKEKEKLVLLKGEGVLLSMPEASLVLGLKKALKKGAGEVVDKALILLAEFQVESTEYYEFLVGKLKTALKDKDKLAILEALGVLGNQKAIPLLESFLYGSPILSYTATASILKILGRINTKRDRDSSDTFTYEVFPGTPEDVFIKYLKYPKLSVLSKQMVLRHIIKKGGVLKRASGEQKSPLEELLISQLKNPNMNIRYLSTQALLLVNAESAFEPMVESLLIESDPTTLKLLRQSILSLFSMNPDLLITVLEKNKERERTVRILLYALLEAPIMGSQALKIIPQLFGPPLNFMSSPYANDCIAFLFIQILKNNVDLKDLLHEIQNIPGKEILMKNLVDYFKAHPHAKIPLPVDTLKEWLFKKEEASKGPIIDLLALSHDRSAIPLLVSASVDPSYKPFHSNIVEALNHLVWQAL